MEFSAGTAGTTSLPLKETDDGMVYPDASVSEVHRNSKRVVRNQVRVGIEAEKRGFDRVQFPERHFEVTGLQHSPNPIVSLAYTAAETDDIRLMQMANILPWHDPVRLAEQIGMLDNLSGGRVDVGIGRGYIPKEAEVLGQYWGGGTMNQEMNRVTFEEKYEILTQAWTEDVFSYHGQFHDVPPKHVEYDYDLDEAYLSADVTDHGVDDVIDREEGVPTLRTLSVFPQPQQEPHPPIWQAVMSDRSIEWAAKRGLNGYAINIDELDEMIDLYHETAEEAGWPDRQSERSGEAFKRGWDERRQRGIVPRVFVFNTDAADEETYERWKRGQLMVLAHRTSLGAIDPGVDVANDDRDDLVDVGPVVHGDSEEIIDRMCSIKERCGYDDFIVDVTFDSAGLTLEDELEQMRVFSEKVMPYLDEQFPSPET